jgi:glycosyltransferase A (GT-A) superfamily protein (DUF2064 family)
MSPPLSFEQAAELYACMLADVLAATAEAAAGAGLAPWLAVHPPEAVLGFATDFRHGVPRDFRIVAQRGRDLSERMAFAAAEAAAGGARRVLLRGSDSPTVDGDTVAGVLDRLEEDDVVLCPDPDGGYNVVGLRRPRPGLFDQVMSRSTVLSDTLANARRLGLRASVVGQSFDIDSHADLALLADARREGHTTQCPRTLAYLDESALWP